MTIRLSVAMVLCAVLPLGCANVGRLTYVAHTAAPVSPDTTAHPGSSSQPSSYVPGPMFGDTLIGLVPGSADSSRRFLGRLRDGYTADTLNLILVGDNRPGFRITRLAPEATAIKGMFSLNPGKFFRGLVAIPVGLAKGLFPDFVLLRDIPAKITHRPTYGMERQVLSAVLAKIDSLNKHGQVVSAVVNSGDLVEDGRRPDHWKRFLTITHPLTQRVPYFPVAGNHERTDTEEGVENWRAATGLPVGSSRLYYCFDTADSWLRVIALDTNPIVDPGAHWTREVQVKYSDEEFKWLVDRVKEHVGPVVVLMHHPPFSASFHRMEWQRDSVLKNRRERMVRALHDASISIIVSGHEHGYQRALLTWPDAVLIALVSGGGGAPLHSLPPPAESARLFSEYRVAGSIVKPENVFTAQTFHFIHLRLWFGGGELYTYSVDSKSKATMIDRVQIDLKRFGTPKVDQHKIPIAPSKGPTEVMKEDVAQKGMPAKVDSTSASKRLLSKPPPGKIRPTRRTTRSTRTSARP
jgi:predicted MPP superfamily phosphohydrolase